MSFNLSCFVSASFPVRLTRTYGATNDLLKTISPSFRVCKRHAIARCSYDVNPRGKQETSLSPSRAVKLARLKNKLVTREDRDWVHKVAGLVHLSTSAILITNLAYTTIVEHGLPDIPTSSWFDFLLVSWVISTMIQGINGAALAYRFRRFRQESAVFVGTGLSSALNAWIAWFSSPHFPSFLHNGPITPMIVTALSFSGLASVALTCIDAKFLTERRLRHRRKKTSQREEILANIAYNGPIVVGAPLFLGAFRMAVQRGHEGYTDLLSTMPHLDSFGVYNSVLWAVAATVAAFVVTLRDRQVISPEAERQVIVVSAIVAFAYFMGGMLSLNEWWRLWQ